MIKTVIKKLLFNIGNSFNKNILPSYKASVIERVKSESKKQSAEFIVSNLSNADVVSCQNNTRHTEVVPVYYYYEK